MSAPDNFDDVRRLLRCKRYEQPPPGYFVSLSDKIMARIEAEETAGYSSWWSWFVDRFDAKPVLVCAYGLAVSSLLFMGFRLSQVFEAEMSANPPLSGPWLAVTPGSPLGLPQAFSQSSLSDGDTVGGWNAPARTVPVGHTGHLFFPASGLHVQPVSFNLGQ